MTIQYSLLPLIVATSVVPIWIIMVLSLVYCKGGLLTTAGILIEQELTAQKAKILAS